MTRVAPPIALSLSIVAVGCADSGPARTEAEGASSDVTSPQMEPLDGSEEAKLQLTVDGRGEPMDAQARIDVVEGEREVVLTITGADDAGNLVMIDLAIDGVENVVGEHLVELAAPESNGPYAAAIFDGQAYESSDGEVELRVSGDGSISGNFDIPLVPASSGAGEAAVPEPMTKMAGVFSGSWNVTCLSPIRGFTGGHAVSDSPYCNSLEF